MSIMENKVKISTQNLNLYYGENHALKNINLDLYENKITAFIENFQTFGAIAVQNGDNFGCGEYAETPVLGNLSIDSTGCMICFGVDFP